MSKYIHTYIFAAYVGKLQGVCMYVCMVNVNFAWLSKMKKEKKEKKLNTN